MPRRKNPKLLQDVCLQVVAECICAHSVHSPTSVLHKGISNGIFSENIKWLPSAVMEKLIKIVHQLQPGGIYYNQLELLLSANVRTLCLQYSASKGLRNVPLGFQRLLKKIAVCGRNLVDLGLTGCVLWNNEELVNTIRCLPSLRRLVLYSSKLNDEVLVTVGETCNFIAELYISGWYLSDQGLLGLFGSATDRGRCPHLHTLIIDSDRNYQPNITLEAVVRVLQNQPQLTHLKIPKLTEAILFLGRKENFLSAHFPIRLGLMTYQDDLYQIPLTPEEVKILVSLCPSLSEIKISIDDPRAITELSKLKFLTHLSLTDCRNHTCRYFMEAFTQLLAEVGIHISHLELVATEVDVSAINRHCPHLKSLECLKILRILRCRGLDQELPYFQELSTLKLFPSEVNSISDEELVLLLGSCHCLKHLFVGWCDSLTDDCMARVLEKNSFFLLQELELSDIPAITINGIKLLLLSENNLYSCNILSCDQISKADVVSVKKMAETLNLNLTIKFYD